jgi:hypothetical protein
MTKANLHDHIKAIDLQRVAYGERLLVLLKEFTPVLEAVDVGALQYIERRTMLIADLINRVRQQSNVSEATALRLVEMTLNRGAMFVNNLAQALYADTLNEKLAEEGAKDGANIAKLMQNFPNMNNGESDNGDTE